ncbi:hypothetical protein BJ878DRAFT_495564 [Calycina marina]|uniref:Uncharacterized protein n=1 Tax=Calycina marina TaxID=1763456 RepID=A0A9P7Z755_9HELO|nr:hypothetical protein BJ878DRAFT_495564 [Calycina marina]
MTSVLYTIEIEEAELDEYGSSKSLLSKRHIGIASSSCSTYAVMRRCCMPLALATYWEILLVICASFITTTYTVKHENHTFAFADFFGISDNSLDLDSIAFLLDPSPALMLSSCLMLGCSVSSFVHRRQKFDVFQAPIFILVSGITVMFGAGLHMHSNIIMLVLIPWALCTAMVMTCLAHWLSRRCGGQRSRILFRMEETEVLVGKH